MKWFLLLFSLLMIAAGCGYILYTKMLREALSNLFKASNEKIIAVLVAVLGLVLILSAGAARQSGFIVLLGITAMGKGLFIFLNPKGYYKQAKQWFLEQASDQTYRLFGIIALILGTAVFSWIF
ncbi:MAG: hypothetical protein WBG37_05180 [Desulfobacterales bacterium]|jgi:uncharacterized protein YjeT (DUF2065 family)